MENLGTIWVCVDCMLHHANGECGSCHNDENGHDEEPLGKLLGQEVAMGMGYDEHAEDCDFRTKGADAWTAGYGCDCETNTFSRSQCEGCGSYLHGERHAMSLLGEK